MQLIGMAPMRKQARAAVAAKATMITVTGITVTKMSWLRSEPTHASGSHGSHAVTLKGAEEQLRRCEAGFWPVKGWLLVSKKASTE